MPELSKISGEVIIPEDLIPEIHKGVQNIPDFKNKIEQALHRRITEILQLLLAGSLKLEISDIHIEPEQNRAKLRLRADGVLHDILYLELDLYKTLRSRIKLLSGIKLNVTSRAQDGRFSVVVEKNMIVNGQSVIPSNVEIRTSVLPAEFGESIVMRLLHPKWLVDVEGLGLRPDLYKVFLTQIQKPHGMIIMTGPTGAGKTTTLYAMLRKINNPEVKVITIEDPIEYHLAGISQTQVDPAKGYTFANGLRAIVRQDPDIILVGEIRDLETAQIGMQAALTGHLLLTTLHTNDAAGTVARLWALGEKSVNIAPAMNMAVAQRLVRMMCQKCFKLEKVTPEQLEKFHRGLRKIPKTVRVKKIDTNTKIPKAVGCRDCNFTGYKNRTGIFEAFVVDDEMERYILRSPSVIDMRELAIKKGMVLMYQDGLIKVLEGVTTLEEIDRVTGEETT